MKYLTNKSINEDQLQEFLSRLLDAGIIAPSNALDNILSTYKHFLANPNHTYKHRVYDLEQGKVVAGTIQRMNFALSHIGIIDSADNKKLLFILDGTKVICTYEFKNTFTGADVYYFIVSLLSEGFNVIPLLNPSKEEIEEIVGVEIESSDVF